MAKGREIWLTNCLSKPSRNRLVFAGFLLCCMGSQAEWVYFHSALGNSREYYNPAISRQGNQRVVRTFSRFSVPDMVPLDDPVSAFKFRLEPFSSEQSSYEIDCKANTVQLMRRTFYRDPEGKIQIVTYQRRDKFIAQSSSEFARQFQKTVVFPEDVKAVKLMRQACGG